MDCWVLTLLCLTALASQVSAEGVLLALFPNPGLKGDKEAAWVIPDSAAGCSSLPEALTPTSGKVWWDSKDGKASCAALLFYSSANCGGAPTLTLTNPSKKGASTEDTDFSKKGPLALASSAKSVRCASASFSTPLPVVGAAATPDLWLAALNAARSQGRKGSNPLQWDAALAAKAQAWTAALNKDMCGAEQVLLGKIPSKDSGASESDVWISFSTKESDAVAAWAPDLKDDANPRTARILDSSATSVGCGKTACEGGAFFTCLFTPITY